MFLSPTRPRCARASLDRRDRDRTWDAATALRLRMLDDHARAISSLDAREREATKELAKLVAATESTLGELCGLATATQETDAADIAKLIPAPGRRIRLSEASSTRCREVRACNWTSLIRC